MHIDAELTEAARNGETQKVLEIIRRKNIPDTIDEEYALGSAIKGRQIETVKALLQLNVLFGEWKWTGLLNSAAGAGSLEMLALLVENLKDSDVPVAEWMAGRRFVNNYNSLNSASFGGNPHMIEYFLAQGAEVAQENLVGKTALFYAAGENTKFLVREREREAVGLLLDHGASINHKDNEGNTPLFSSILNLNRETPLELLERGADVSLFNIHNLSPLRAALKCGRVKIADRLINCGASLSETDNQGLTTRDWAREISIPRVMEWLSKQP